MACAGCAERKRKLLAAGRRIKAAIVGVIHPERAERMEKRKKEAEKYKLPNNAELLEQHDSRVAAQRAENSEEIRKMSDLERQWRSGVDRTALIRERHLEWQKKVAAIAKRAREENGWPPMERLNGDEC